MHEGCQVLPCFNMPGKKTSLYCSEHKKPEMINVKSKICIHEGCEQEQGLMLKVKQKHYIVQNIKKKEW